MKISQPISFMCLARYFNSSNKLLEQKIIFIVKSSGDIPIMSLMLIGLTNFRFDFGKMNECTHFANASTLNLHGFCRNYKCKIRITFL